MTYHHMLYEIRTAPITYGRPRLYIDRAEVLREAKAIAKDYGATLNSVDVVNLTTGDTLFSLRRTDESGWHRTTPGGL